MQEAHEKKRRKFEQTPCLEALAELGIITHMLQDYYAHGVEKDDETGHIVGVLRGNPDNPQMVPVSFGALGFTGGHGGFWRLINPFSRVEPGDRAVDQSARKNGAVQKNKAELIQSLNQWLRACNCVYKRMQ